jgi:hypothetical protein
VTRFVEGHTIVTSGSMTCPHPRLADVGPSETYLLYVHRHVRDHNLGPIEDDEDAERNLGVWCLYYCARHVIGNESLGIAMLGTTTMKAYWEPCWEDAEIIANWVFAPSDTEQEVPWKERTFRLKPYEERDHLSAQYKRFKKLTKVRDTQKTSWGKAYITFRQLHAYFVEDRPNYRVLVISAIVGLARNHYLTPLADLWEAHENLQRLYGTVTYTRRYYALKARYDAGGSNVTLADLEAQTRRLCLLAPGSKPKDTLRLRWNIKQPKGSGMTAISLMVAGMTSTTGGNRWDLVAVDDPVSIENAATTATRKKVKMKVADLRKQGDADSEFLMLNTPYNADDVTSTIDRDQGYEYHIFYRPATWIEPATHTPIFYWEYNALSPGRPKPGQPPRNAVWTESRIESERYLPNFHSQVLLRIRDEANAMFSEEDFPIVDADRFGPEITAGLGGMPITDEERAAMIADGVEIHAYLLVDPAGNELATKDGAETAVIGARISRFGEIVVCHARAGHMTATQEQDEVYEGWVRTGAQVIRYEYVSAGKKHVRKSYLDFQAKKSEALKHPVIMPIDFKDASTTASKDVRVPQMEPHAKAGRIKILRSAAPLPVLRKLIAQFTDWGPGGNLKDMADALSMILDFTRFDAYEETPTQKRAKAERFGFDDEGTLHIPASFILDQIKTYTGKALPWGKRH